MPTCFVIQPFDSGKFDKRFKEIYNPAIEGSGFEAYRVDQDNHVSVPIDSIEAGIRNASICLADITLDNPNVWYELGYSFASGKSVVIICSSEREGKKYPFDIQHRSIIPYSPDSLSDYHELHDRITERIKGYSEQVETLEGIAASSSLVPVNGLSAQEITIVATIASNVYSSAGKVRLWDAWMQASKTGLTKLGFNLGQRRLISKGLILSVESEDLDGNMNEWVQITERGWDWIDINESWFFPSLSPKVSHTEHRAKSDNGDYGIADDDIPF